MLLAAILSAWSAISDSSSWTFSASPAFELAAEPSRGGGPVFTGLAESYGSQWRALRADPEQARLWERSPSLAQLSLDAKADSFELRVVLPLRRDLMAWSRDPWGSNVPDGPDEVDINVPYEGWVRMSGRMGALQAGRFRKSFSESPHGVILGSDLVHDAFWWTLPMGPWNFQWFASSLNPWLLGTDDAGSVQPGSEADIQAHRTVLNQRGRHYAEPWKTLFLHRLSWSRQGWELAAVEQLMVGGKVPAMRDFLPLVAWHDNYGDGYSKISTALEVSCRRPRAGDFHLQALVEEMRSPVGEDSGTERRVVFAANAGWLGRIRTSAGGWTLRLDATTTSPTLNNHELPLLKGVSRRLYRSNYFEQADPAYADTWVVDQPLAYHRGPDALDFWSLWRWDAPDSSLGAYLELDWLSQGDADLGVDPIGLQSRVWPLSGVVETRLRMGGGGWMEWNTLRFAAGVELERIGDADHRRGEDLWETRLHGSVGRSW
ncbi:MAG TPA: hypothetical protein PKY05_00525 [Fibrobacteria bacterium]|nr:hypothetical protein [Fibrobacteria bacterium]